MTSVPLAKYRKVDDAWSAALDAVIERALEYEKVTGELRAVGISGEVGELRAAQLLRLQLAENRREAGHDAIDENGCRLQIKTRKSERRKQPRGSVGKFAKGSVPDAVLLVTLGLTYKVTGIWRSNWAAVADKLSEKNEKRKADPKKGETRVLSVTELKAISNQIYASPTAATGTTTSRIKA